ncbi:MAG: YggT family protein [Gammaproteobacteria bacterium]
MGSNYLVSPLTLIINTLVDLYILLVLLRFLLQVLKADFYNPVSQFIVRVTSAPLKVLRRFTPSISGQDTASIVLCLGLIYIKFIVLRLLDIQAVPIGSTIALIGSASYVGLFIYSIADLVSLTLSVFLIAIIIQVILSWISPGHYNPVVGLVNTLAAPVLRPVRKLIPPMGGLDLSPIFAALIIMVGKLLIIPPIVYLGSL